MERPMGSDPPESMQIDVCPRGRLQLGLASLLETLLGTPSTREIMDILPMPFFISSLNNDL